MRADRPRDTRHNKDHDNLKSSLKKGNKTKKNRVVFDESANEFFEADYIIVVRDECSYSDEGESEECGGCGACERYQEGEGGALSPPEGYKDLGLFNRDGTLREQAWWEAGDVVLVGERSGTVFTPHHLHLLRRLQRERMLRAAICADCDAHASLHHPIDLEYGYEEEENSDVDRERERERERGARDAREPRAAARRTGKHIAAGEERPRINSSQQTTPTDDGPPTMCIEETQTELPLALVSTSEESDAGDVEGRASSESSPMRHRRGGILKGGRLWKSFDKDGDKDNEQMDDQRSVTTGSDEDGSVTPRAVRFVEKPVESAAPETEEKRDEPQSDSENALPKDYGNNTHKLDTPLILSINTPKSNSAVQQLFNSGRPPPPAIEPQLVTSETLRAWDAGVRPKAEEAAVRRVAERNALRCSLLRSEARKKQQPKETTSLAERIRLLTCDVEEELEERSSPAGGDKYQEKFSDKGEKAFGSASSSSSSSTLSAPAPTTRPHPPDLGDHIGHHDTHKAKPEPRRQFLSTLAPLTACVGSTAQHEGFYYLASAGSGSGAGAERASSDHEHSDAPAPDVVAGTPDYHQSGGEEDGLAAFARATAPRTERLRQRYPPDSQPASSDDEHDDYGFHRRPAVRGIAAKQLGAADDMLHQMQRDLAPPHACQRNASYSWQYYSEATATSRPQSRSSTSSNWCSSDYVTAATARTQGAGASAGSAPHADSCYAHAQSGAYAYQPRHQDAIYKNCGLYANIGCSDSSQEVYSSQTSSEATSPVRGRGRRAESPPPIRSQQQLLYVPYAPQYPPEYQPWPQHTHVPHYARVQRAYYPAAAPNRSGASTPQPAAAPPSRSMQSHPLQLQTLCPAPARYRAVPAAQPGGGKQMICYSEKVAAPLYQPAGGSPARARGAPEGAPSTAAPPATSPCAPPHHPVYYAMNV